MKNIITIISIISFLFTPVYGQKKVPGVKITDTSIQKEGDDLLLNFDIIPGKFASNYTVTLTPVIYNGDGKWMPVTPITLVGKKREVYNQRVGHDIKNKYVVKGKNPAVIPYSLHIPFEDWMQYISVAVEQVIEGCCSQFEKPLEDILDPQLLHYQIVPHFNITPLSYELTELEKYDIENPFLHPMEDFDKRYDILFKDRDKGTSVLIFTVGSHKLDMDFQGNKDVLEAIRKAFELIESDPNASLKHIMIAGYASPEGSLAFNTALAQRRAQSVKSFIQTLMERPNEHLFELYNGREDWDGLRERVEKSNMPEKNEILQIIDSYTIEQEIRKTKLKQLYDGGPYKYMLEHFYPALRSAGYVQVYYEIDRKATVATAVTDELGRTTWVDPDSPQNRCVTAVNKSLSFLVDNNYDEALDILYAFKEDSRTWNYLGVCYMMKGDYDEADKYFQQSADSGDQNALLNLQQTQWARKVKTQF